MAEHSYKVGDRVVVRNETLGGRRIIEGLATVTKLLGTDDFYLVRFDTEPDATYERYVEPRE